MFNIISYIIFLSISSYITIDVGRRCYNAGKFYLEYIIHDTNLCLMFQFETVERLVVALSKKIGGFSIYLGIMMLLNLLLFLKGRKHAMNKDKKVENENIDL